MLPHFLASEPGSECDNQNQPPSLRRTPISPYRRNSVHVTTRSASAVATRQTNGDAYVVGTNNENGTTGANNGINTSNNKTNGATATNEISSEIGKSRLKYFCKGPGSNQQFVERI